MAFLFANLNRVWWPVELAQTLEDGTVAVTTIQVLFERMTQKQLKDLVTATMDDLQRRRAELQDSDAPSAGLTAAYEAEAAATERLVERVIDWRGIVDEAGDEVPFSRERLLALLEFRPERQAFAKAWRECSEKAPAKN